MKKLSRVGLGLLVFIVASSSFAAGYVNFPVHDRINLSLLMEFTNHDKTGIQEAIDGSGQQISYGLNKRGSYSSYAIGLETWFPLTIFHELNINGVAFVDHMPGENVVLANDDDDGAVQIKASRTNFAVGLNVVNFYKSDDEDYFIECMLAAGVTRFHARGEFWQGSGGDQAADHPGASSTEPFFMIEAGIGKQLTDQTRGFLFINYSIARRDRPFRLSATNTDVGYADLRIPNQWLKIGLALSRDINI